MVTQSKINHRGNGIIILLGSVHFNNIIKNDIFYDKHLKKADQSLNSSTIVLSFDFSIDV